MRNMVIGLKCRHMPHLPSRNSLVLVACLLAWHVAPTAAQDKGGDQLLDAAQAYMREASGFHVEVEITFQSRKASIKADIVGDDYDISLIGGKGFEVRGVRQEYWKSYDGGKTWQQTDSLAAKEMFDLLVAPIYRRHVRAISGGRVDSDPEQKQLGDTHYAVTHRHSEGGQTITVLELLRPNDSPPDNQRIRYWVAQSKGKTWIERSTEPTLFLGSSVFVDSQYSKVGEISRIDRPPKN
jgi:hypothetical protein